MIPIRLTLKNFLCYREGVPPLDFTGLHVACLCGGNGHGKSALLDAITWALWGHARSKTHDALISHGAEECQVTLTFQARDVDYEVVRTHGRGTGKRQGVSTLSLCAVGDISRDEDYAILTGATIRETQEQIIQIIGMDYDTFINSAFLLQGRADEFSSKPPAERKAVLAKILGLEEYDTLQTRAKTRLQEVVRATAGDEGALTHMAEQVEEIGDPGVELSQVESTLRDLGPQLEQVDRNVATSKERVAELERKQAQASTLKAQIEKLQGEQAGLEATQVAAREKVLQYRQIIEQADVVREGADGLEQARIFLRALEDSRQAFYQLRSEADNVERIIGTARTRLESGKEQLVSHLRGLNERLPLHESEATAPSGPWDEWFNEDRCPLCQQPMGVAERERVRAQATKDWYAILDEIKAVEQQLIDADQVLRHDTFAPGERNHLEELNGQIANLGYDDAARSQAYTDTQALAHFAGELPLLEAAEASLPQEEAAYTQAIELLANRDEAMRHLVEQVQADADEVLQLPGQKRSLLGEEALQQTLEAERTTALDRRGYLTGQVERLAKLQEDMATAETRLAESRDEQGIYQELSTAFGRQGVQAMLIETVVPRLEEEANQLLGRMTDGTMQLTLETQREKRSAKGEMAETLEIFVADELGPRHYEMYSGGEAFRVNLSLRIALSRVLAQRTGAPMPVLFIDEGFGSQDMTGRERVMDAIGAISDDFEKIIVITHLDDLKEMFPARIEVSKGANGSTFQVN